MQQSIIGVDIGGTSTRVGLFPTLNDPQCALLAHFPTQPDYATQLDALTAVLDLASIGAGIGLAVGARIARDGGSVAVAPNLRSYEGQPLRDWLATRYRCTVRLAHDAVCGLLGERQLGVLQGQERCAYLTISTGTGAAVAQRDQLLSIEIGHQLLDGNERVCLCGQVGCLETYTGGRQIALHEGHPLEEIDDLAFWQDFIEKLALGLVNLAQLTRIEMVAISGGIALHRPTLLPHLQARVDARLWGSALRLVPATLGEDAPLVGAAQLLRNAATVILH